MQIADAHLRTAIFENLDVTEEGDVSQRGVLVAPSVHHRRDIFPAHGGDRKIVPRRKTRNPADPLFASRYQKTSIVQALAGHVARHGRKIVIEYEGVRVIRIANPVGALVPRA
jgi:hypothetical protein